ncbi:hypothetical protein F5880DRAFT_1617699 [Lentinula raphanica]|nr:hypothetical protein F5880DRAFT_1617699 [Lentinula raphanica]
MSFNKTLADVTLALRPKELESDSGKMLKVKDPEPFDGSNPQKLKSFLQKINYALSYLTGTTREWFEPDILNLNVEALPA